VKTILAICLIVLLLLPVSAFGEIQTINHTVKQPFGGSQSPDDARISAVAKAKREALEMAGTYIESLTVVKNYQVDKDEILALAAGVLKAEVVSQKNYASDDAFGIDVVVKVVVDTSVLESRVKKLLQDRTHLEQLNQARKKEKELLNKVASLEEETRRLSQQNKSSKDMKKQFHDVSQGLSAFELVGQALLTDGNPRKSIEYYDKAIRLKPDFAFAYYMRGLTYGILKEYQQCLEDLNEALRIEPDNAEAYSMRAFTYGVLGDYLRAVEDSKKAIRLKPDYAEAYVNRGKAYGALAQHKHVIEDSNKAIRLNPDLVEAYYIRGRAYSMLNENQRAVEDLNQAIRLKPDYAEAYVQRGAAYFSSDKIKDGCRSFMMACKLGSCEAYDISRLKGFCPQK
jgi:tetratricopeptide (TPR) repeat protein